jgi:hypothetical protein
MHSDDGNGNDDDDRTAHITGSPRDSIAGPGALSQLLVAAHPISRVMVVRLLAPCSPVAHQHLQQQQEASADPPSTDTDTSV